MQMPQTPQSQDATRDPEPAVGGGAAAAKFFKQKSPSEPMTLEGITGDTVTMSNRGRLLLPAFVVAQGLWLGLGPKVMSKMGAAPQESKMAAAPAAAPSVAVPARPSTLNGGEALAKYFPGALGSAEVDAKVWNTLRSRGYTPANTLFAASTCPDEINYKPYEMLDLMTRRWGEMFQLGGLAGVPFVGRAGFGAMSHHVPEGGKMVIVFAPHVGIVDDGTIGKIKRDNQAEVTTACGAAVGAFKALMKEKSADPALESDYFDAQINYIVAKLRSRIGEAADAPDVQAFVAYQMYDLVRQLFVEELTTTGGFFDYGEEVTVIGGIQINRANGGDCFMPLMMQSRTKEDGSVVDLFQETFGAPPETKLREVLAGSKINLYDYKLEKGAAAAGSGKVNLK